MSADFEYPVDHLRHMEGWIWGTYLMIEDYLDGKEIKIKWRIKLKKHNATGEGLEELRTRVDKFPDEYRAQALDVIKLFEKM